MPTRVEAANTVMDAATNLRDWMRGAEPRDEAQGDALVSALADALDHFDEVMGDG